MATATNIEVTEFRRQQREARRRQVRRRRLAALGVLVALANPALPPPLVKEAIASLGTAHHERSEAALVTIVQRLEGMLANKADAPFDEAELQPLLDRAVSALARFGSVT